MTFDGVMSSFMGSFTERQEAWKMIELSSLETKLRVINVSCLLIIALCFYDNTAYFIIYNIIILYQIYINWLKTATYDKFNKAMSRLRIKIKHGFAIHQNFWTWNSFHLGLKFWQKVVVRYVVFVLLINVWTCFSDNQTSILFLYMLPVLEQYLALPKEESNNNSFMEVKLIDDKECFP